jgi:hypothetical protein
MNIQTEHYNFIVNVKKNYRDDIYYSEYLEVGNPEKPCLSLTINTAEAEEIFGAEFIKTAKLSNIEALYECVLQDAKELFEKYSFGKELLQWVIHYIKTNFPHVKYLQLDDNSYIPCNRELNDTLDLLSYSIAIHCKTWYEFHFSAFIKERREYDIYKNSIEIYKRPETKAKVSWEVFYLKYITKPYPLDIIKNNEDKYKIMYNESLTFPDFFKSLSKSIDRENKCKFFKEWLQEFINSYVKVSRRWIIQLKREGGRRQTKKANYKK